MKILQITEKIRINLDIKTFITIIVVVWWFVFSTSKILNKIDNLYIAQVETKKQMEQTTDKIDDIYACQVETDKKIAWLEPTVNMILNKLGL